MNEVKRIYVIEKCAWVSCGKRSEGVPGDKHWIYGKGETWCEADCHHCGGRNRAELKPLKE